MPDVPVHITRRRGQKNIRIRVKNGNVLVSAPYFCRSSEIEKFVNSQNTWINKQISKHRALQEHADKALNEGKWLIDGKWILYQIVQSRLETVRYDGSDLLFLVKNPHSVDKTQVLSIFQNWAKIILKERFWETARQIGLMPVKVSIRSQQSKWGSCSARKTISLNWRLVKCPPEIQRYIFIHELCHLEQMNHSPAFWQLVDHHYPNRKAAEKWLRDNSRAMFLD